MRAAFLCFYTPEVAHYAGPASKLNKMYCDRHGHEFICETDAAKIRRGLADRSIYWYYFKMLEEHWGDPKIDWFLKLDCDAAVVDQAFDLSKWTNGDHDLIYTTDVGPDRINAGVQLIRNAECCKQFYKRVWDAAEVVARGSFKTACFHEQTILSAAIALHGADHPKIKIVSNDTHGSFNGFYSSNLSKYFIFHDIKKRQARLEPRKENPDKYFLGTASDAPVLAPATPAQFDPSPAKPPAAPMPKDAPVAVVYYAYLVNEWRALVAEQINHLKSSGLYDAATVVWVMSSGTQKDFEELKGMMAPHDKILLEHTANNSFELPGISKVKGLGDSGDWKILYFHTKGVANNFQDAASRKVSDLKVAGARSWRLFMEYFLIDRWKDCVKALDENDVVAAYYNHGDKWPYGNFWWATSAHIKTCEQPQGAGRWYFESWITTKGAQPRIHEFSHLELDFHVSEIPPWLYDGSRSMKNEKIVIVKAEYGSPTVQIDEGRPTPLEKPVARDVTEAISSAVNMADGRCLDFRVTNEALGGDPIYGVQKTLSVWWQLESDSAKTYHLAAMEGTNIKLELPL